LSAPGKKDEGLPWQHVVISLQILLDHPVAVGGRTALELQGFGHYLSAAGPREVHVYSNRNLPGWVSRLPLDTRLVLHSATKLFKNGAIPAALGKPTGTATAQSHANLIQKPWGHWNWPLVMSGPERAILELLDEVPQRETFHQADMLMEGLRNLSPRRLHTLLSDCRSVKVKRLFLWFAERHNHSWLSKLDRSGMDLGRGKRMLVRGGKLDKKFNITVPETLDAGI
jgi:Transcriptional regulator, AbiEi antitoxin, Type IV TA system/Transcriptional regulator, AbiEi antitoxin N-terminal domain